jgi:hypothetical protein
MTSETYLLGYQVRRVYSDLSNFSLIVHAKEYKPQNGKKKKLQTAKVRFSMVGWNV